VPGDPQDPAHQPPGDAPVDVTFPEFGDFLDIDAADVRTLASMPVSVGAGPLPVLGLVLSDRAPGGGWSNPAPIAQPRILFGDVHLAVNASGAAVVMWLEERRNSVLFASYRDAAGAGWTAPGRVPAPGAFNFAVDIDDAGRVLLAYDRIVGNREGVWAVRRASSGRWGATRRVGGPGKELFSLGLGAGGAAVVTYGHFGGPGYGRPDRPPFARRMSPTGNWRAPVRQPDRLGSLFTGVDAKGRALITGWRGTDLIGRWSRSDGRWRTPFVLAADARTTIRELEVVVNRRGDALLVWAETGPGRPVWARYQPAGQDWTKPVKLTQADNPPRKFSAALGDCGHAAIAWSTLGNHQLIQIRRAFPTP
jgi:hypothetical protein